MDFAITAPNKQPPESAHVHFLTGRLAEHALRQTLTRIQEQQPFDYSIQVLPITVAALMSPEWIARNWQCPQAADRIILPGYCEGDLSPLADQCSASIERGPRDLRRLPEFFGQVADDQYDGSYEIEIIAEINHAPRLRLDDIAAEAKQLVADGADLIDVGCEPGTTWAGVEQCVKALKDEGMRVSIDSLNPAEIAPAAKAGAELVLSVNSANRDAAADWGIEVVAIPDDPRTLAELDETVDVLAQRGVPLRIDPILEPVGCGFAASLARYISVRQRYPDAEMMMGIGNLTELSDVDSAGINFLLLGMCQELSIRSVLTTQVINWARSSVRECDLARRLVYHAVRHQIPPKRLDPGLVVLRDDRLREFGEPELDELATQIKDNNYRMFAEGGEIHLVSKQLRLSADDPFRLFDELMKLRPETVDESHAFYLGFECAKALMALKLGKQYEQDESLDWGHLTQKEDFHRIKRKKKKP